MEDSVVEGWCVLNSCFRGKKKNPYALPGAGVILFNVFSIVLRFGVSFCSRFLFSSFLFFLASCTSVL